VAAGFGAGQREEIPREIDTDHESMRADDLSRSNRRRTASAAHVQDVCTSGQPKPRDRGTTEAIPRIRGIILALVASGPRPEQPAS
jgi:hypothetical protein